MLSQPSNAEAPMDHKFSPKDIDVNPLHSLKAPTPIEVIVEGIDKVVSPVKPANV